MTQRSRRGREEAPAQKSKGAVDPLRVVTGVCRASYAHLKEPHAFNPGDTPEYSVVLLIPKDDDRTLSKIEKAIQACYNANKALIKLPFDDEDMYYPLRDGKDWLKKHPEAKEYKDCMFLRVKSSTPVPGFYADKSDVLDMGDFYSGCYIRAEIKASAFNQKGNAGISFYVNSVMFMEDGEPLAGSVADPDIYDED